jgi:hypothetical protein
VGGPPGRLFLTHDARTVPQHAYARVEAGLAMPGVMVVRADTPLGLAIDDLLLFVECSGDGEWEGRIAHIPL